MNDFSEQKRDEKLEGLRRKEAEDIARLLAQRYQRQYVDLSRMTIEVDALKVVDEADARAARLAVFQRVGNILQVAAMNPELPQTKTLIEKLKEIFTIEVSVASEMSLERAWERYKEISKFTETTKGIIDISPERLKEFGKQTQTFRDVASLIEPIIGTKQQRTISTVLEIVLAGALTLDASDIHIEPKEKTTRLRMRLDGVLHDVLDFPLPMYQLMLSRIKLLSELKLNVHDRAQDGRFTIRTEKTDIEVRTSILPGPYGESVVLRVLNPKTIALALKDLGFHPSVLEIIGDKLREPNGMILTTGPTGSGKTTTLYAFLKAKRTPDIKIITIEDPIEYHLDGITQTQVNAAQGYDFAHGLRAILRQDPDVIMVGEIRDLETAETALHAALTGHLVFSTLHTNNAAGTIPRLIDLGAKPNIIAPAINVAMAQRLVRLLCSECSNLRAPNAKEMKVITAALAALPPHIAPPQKPFTLRDARTCSACNHIGYKGRIAVAEAFVFTDAIGRLIFKNPAEADIQDAAVKQGMLTMQQDGILKALGGATSMEELSRVLGI